MVVAFQDFRRLRSGQQAVTISVDSAVCYRSLIIQNPFVPDKAVAVQCI